MTKKDSTIKKDSSIIKTKKKTKNEVINILQEDFSSTNHKDVCINVTEIIVGNTIDNIIDTVISVDTTTNNSVDITIDTDTDINLDTPSTPIQPIIKKRGRKPKGGKIVQQLITTNNVHEPKSSVILHLKCSLKDLENNMFKTANIESYHFSQKNDLNYEVISNPSVINTNHHELCNINENDIDNDNNTLFEEEKQDNTDYLANKHHETKQTWQKLKILENDLHINNISDTKSACFWCTYTFDNPPIYIPKHYVQNSYHVYGCFCSPECATAYLMQENIDSSAKFERYQLLNHIYSKVYEYKKSIKPAPNPYYLLDKYYGNLTIQEYRSLLKNDRLFLIVDKPLTRILPELHEDNDDFIINNKIIPSNNNTQIKTKLRRKTQTKNNIVQEKFGLNQ